MNDDQLIKDAQYRKGASIAFFNSTNAAIALVSNPAILEILSRGPAQSLQEVIIQWRDFFLNEHKEYYKTVIEKIGGPYDPKVALSKLAKVKTLKDLHVAWLMFSEDERQDENIAKAARVLKEKFSGDVTAVDPDESVLDAALETIAAERELGGLFAHETTMTAPKKVKKAKRTNKKKNANS